ncbi:MAG: hypothetical protein HW376_461 [candidate division NC10 bacterium]|nr:hypothetical protein [candidate division NC10 bacterium]
MGLPGAPGATLKVVLQVGVAPRHLDDALDGGLGERGTTQIGVDDHAGCVDQPPQGRSIPAPRGLPRLGDQSSPGWWIGLG